MHTFDAFIFVYVAYLQC